MCGASAHLVWLTLSGLELVSFKTKLIVHRGAEVLREDGWGLAWEVPRSGGGQRSCLYRRGELGRIAASDDEHCGLHKCFAASFRSVVFRSNLGLGSWQLRNMNHVWACHR